MKVSDDREYALDLAVLEVDEIHDIFYNSVIRTTIIYRLLGPRGHSMLAVKNAEFSIHFAVSFLL